MISTEAQLKLITTILKFNTKEYGYLQPNDILKPYTIIIDNVVDEDTFDSYYIDSSNTIIFNFTKLRGYNIEKCEHIYCIQNNGFIAINKCLINMSKHMLIECYDDLITSNVDSIINLNNISIINCGAFNNNNTLSSISFNNVLYILEDSFTNTPLVNVNLPNINKIYDTAFYNCVFLQKINMRSVLYIGNYSFYNCVSILSIELSELLTYLGKGAFKNCKSLRTINLECTNISELPSSIFNGCENLLYIILPPTIKSISFTAFWNCTLLKYLYCKNFNHIVKTNISANSLLPNDFKLVVPDNLFIEWKNTEPFEFALTHIISEKDFLKTLC